MNFSLFERARAFLRVRSKKRIWYRFLRMMAVVVVFVTTYMLILPAITMEKPTICGKEEHTHTQECYAVTEAKASRTLACQVTSENPIIHTHDDNCYDEAGNLVCQLPEVQAHTHTDACAGEENLICGIDHPEEDAAEAFSDDSDVFSDGGEMFSDGETHVHTEACYGKKAGTTCTLPEIVPHTHGEDCYNKEGTLICTLPEIIAHQHTEECFAETAPSEPELICGKEEHIHTEECYAPEPTEEPTMVPEATEAPTEEPTMTPEATEAPTEEPTMTPEAPTEEPTMAPEVTETPTEETEQTETPATDTITPVVEEEIEQTEIPVADTSTPADKIENAEPMETETPGLDTNALPGIVEDIEYIEAENNSEAVNADTQVAVLDLKPYITSVLAQKKVGNYWVESREFTDGDSINLKLNYSIPGKTIPGNMVSYTFPEGMTIPKEEISKLQNLPVTQDGKVVGHASIVQRESGEYQAVITFNTAENKPAGESTLDPQKPIKGNFSLEATIAAGDSQTDKVLDFGGDNGEIIIRHKDTDLSVYKSGSIATMNDDGTVTIDYTIIAYTDQGSDGNVTLEDTLSHGYMEKFEFVESSFKLKKVDANGKVVEEITTPKEDGGSKPVEWKEGADITFKYSDLPPLGAKQSYILTYSVKAKVKAGKEDDYHATLENKIVASDKTDRKEENNRLVPTVKVSKTGELQASERKIKWTIKVSNAKGLELKDTLGDAIKNINMENIVINGEGMGGGVNLTQEQLKNGYVIPANDEYTITYYTDVSSLPEGTTAENTVTVGNKTSTGTVIVKPADWNLNKNRGNYSDIKDEEGRIEKTEINWNVEIAFPDKAWESQTYYDSIQDISGCPGSHYAVVGTLNTQLTDKLKELSGDKVSYKIKYYSDENRTQCIAEHDGTRISYKNGYDDGSKAKSFEIVIQPTDNIDTKKLFGKKINLSYSTTADYSQITQTGAYEIINKGSLNGVDKTAKHDYIKKEFTEPSLSKEGGVFKDQNVNYSSGTTQVDYIRNGNKLYYRLIVSYDRDATSESRKNKDLVITDELPSGASYEEVIIKRRRSDGWENDDLGALKGCKPIISNNETTKGKTLTITLPAGKWFDSDSQYNGFSIYYTVKVDEWNDDNTAEIKNTAHLDTGEPVEHTTTVVNKKDLVAKSCAQYDINGNKLVLDDQKNILGYIDQTSGQFVSDPQTIPSNRVKYTVEINPQALTLNKDKMLTLYDTLTTKMAASLDAGAIKLYYYSESEDEHKGAEVDTSFYSVSHEKVSADEYLMTIRVPDSTALVLEYDYCFDIDNIVDPQVTNKINLKGETSEIKPWSLKKVSASFEVEQARVLITKVDEDDISRKLPNAQFCVEYFKVYEFRNEGGVEVPVLLDNGSWTTLSESAVTNADGILEFEYGTSAGTDTIPLYPGCIYRLTEVSPPTGYAQTSKPYYFATRSSISELTTSDKIYDHACSKGLNGEIKEGEEGYINRSDIEVFGTTGGTARFTNKANSISVKKHWQDFDGYEIAKQNGQIEVELYKQLYEKKQYTINLKNDVYGNDNPISVDGQASITINAGDSIILSCIGGGDLYFGIDSDNEKNVRTYEPERSPASGGDLYTWVIENVSENLTLHLRSANGGYDNSWEKTIDPSETSGFVPVDQTPAYVEKVTLDSNNGWSYTWDDLPLDDKNGKKYLYTIKEVGENGNIYTSDNVNYEVIYNNNNGVAAGEITVINRSQRQYVNLDVEKKWIDSAGNSSHADDTIIFTLYCDGNPIGTYTLGQSAFEAGSDCQYKEVHSGGNWHGIIDNLFAGHTYTVKETDVEGYNASYSEPEEIRDTNGNVTGYKMTITNEAENSTGITVEKKWKKSDNEALLTDEEIAKLLPENAEIKFHVYSTTESFSSASECFDEKGNLKPGVSDCGIITVNSPNWSAARNDLPETDDAGKQYHYWIVEEENSFSQSAVYENNGIDTGTISVTNTIPVRNVTAEKKWKLPDASENMYLEGEELQKYVPSDVKITFHLYGSTTAPDTAIDQTNGMNILKPDVQSAAKDYGTAEVSSATEWKKEWTSLPIQDAQGNPYYYYVTEDGTSHCVNVLNNGAVGNGSITVINEVPTTSVTVNKKWFAGQTEITDETSEESHPSSVTVQLYKKDANGSFAAYGDAVVLSKDSNPSWSYTWDKLPEGKYYVWEVKDEQNSELNDFVTSYQEKKEPIPGETGEETSTENVDGSPVITGGTVTISNTKEITEFEVEKNWVDINGNPITEDLPDEITVELYRKIKNSETPEPSPSVSPSPSPSPSPEPVQEERQNLSVGLSGWQYEDGSSANAPAGNWQMNLRITGRYADNKATTGYTVPIVLSNTERNKTISVVTKDTQGRSIVYEVVYESCSGPENFIRADVNPTGLNVSVTGILKKEVIVDPPEETVKVTINRYYRIDGIGEWENKDVFMDSKIYEVPKAKGIMFRAYVDIAANHYCPCVYEPYLDGQKKDINSEYILDKTTRNDWNWRWDSFTFASGSLKKDEIIKIVYGVSKTDYENEISALHLSIIDDISTSSQVYSALRKSSVQNVFSIPNETAISAATEDGTLYRTVTLKPGNDRKWSYKWTDLPKKDASGNEYTYYVREVFPDGYTPTYQDKDSKTLITNRRGETTSITVKKVWKNYSGKVIEKKDGSSPITIKLIRIATPVSGGQTIETELKTLTMYSPYEPITVSNLLKAGTGSDGKSYTYTYKVKEDPISGYEVSYDNNGGIQSGEITIYNKSTTSESYELPETGGPGTKMYTMGGFLLSVLAVLLMYRQEKRRREVN